MINTNNYTKAINVHRRKVKIVLKSLLVGVFVGFITVLYRLALTYASQWSKSIYGFVSINRIYALPLFLTLILLAYIVYKLVCYEPLIGGSGIPQVKGQLMGHLDSRWFSTLWAKFIGGTIAILAGLSVGREGPSIQLGAATAEGLASKFSSTRTEQKILIASGASAGLSAAFNAPLAGVMFALEEIFKYFSPIVLLATIVSAVAADMVAGFFLV